MCVCVWIILNSEHNWGARNSNRPFIHINKKWTENYNRSSGPAHRLITIILLHKIWNETFSTNYTTKPSCCETCIKTGKGSEDVCVRVCVCVCLLCIPTSLPWRRSILIHSISLSWFLAVSEENLPSASWEWKKKLLFLPFRCSTQAAHMALGEVSRYCINRVKAQPTEHMHTWCTAKFPHLLQFIIPIWGAND